MPSASHNKSDIAESGRLRTYGRRKGHRLSERRQELLASLLPKLALDMAALAPEPLIQLFESKVSDVWLEIGFGAGEHLAWQAEQNQNVGILGCEPFINGLAKMLAEIEARTLDNVRLHEGDGRDVLAWLPEASIGRMFVLFPDPWPKKRHRRRRLVNMELLDQCARALRSGGEFRLASDIGDYAAEMLQLLNRHDAFVWRARSSTDWLERPTDWPATRYEEKARVQGRRSYYLNFERI